MREASIRLVANMALLAVAEYYTRETDPVWRWMTLIFLAVSAIFFVLDLAWYVWR